MQPNPVVGLPASCEPAESLWEQLITDCVQDKFVCAISERQFAKHVGVECVIALLQRLPVHIGSIVAMNAKRQVPMRRHIGWKHLRDSFQRSKILDLNSTIIYIID